MKYARIFIYFSFFLFICCFSFTRVSAYTQQESIDRLLSYESMENVNWIFDGDEYIYNTGSTTNSNYAFVVNRNISQISHIDFHLSPAAYNFSYDFNWSQVVSFYVQKICATSKNFWIDNWGGSMNTNGNLSTYQDIESCTMTINNITTRGHVYYLTIPFSSNIWYDGLSEQTLSSTWLTLYGSSDDYTYITFMNSSYFVTPTGASKFRAYFSDMSYNADSKDYYKEAVEQREKLSRAVAPDDNTCIANDWSGKIVCWFKNLWHSITSGFTAVGNWFGNLTDDIGDFFGNLIDNIGDFFDDLWNKFLYSDFVDWIIDTSNDLTSGNVSDIDDYFEDFEDSNPGSITSIVTSPLRFINKLSNTCHPVVITYRNKNISLPCGDTIFWNRNDVSSFRYTWNLLFGGAVVYFMLTKVFRSIERIKNPDDDRVGVEDL